jgi:transcriptional regulator with XRE-family HTH domain
VADHLRKARLDRGLLQRDVALQIGVAGTTVHNWERSRTAPSIRRIPAIVKFLGYIPYPEPGSFSERLIRCRRELGLSRSGFAKIVSVDESTLARWERGHPSSGVVRERIDSFFMARQKK